MIEVSQDVKFSRKSFLGDILLLADSVQRDNLACMLSLRLPVNRDMDGTITAFANLAGFHVVTATNHLGCEISLLFRRFRRYLPSGRPALSSGTADPCLGGPCSRGTVKSHVGGTTVHHFLQGE